MPAWTNLVLALSKAPCITIAAIRGRTRGGGNELALALGLRHAGREKAIFGQPEVGSGLLPGGGGTERLPRAIGRDRALEAILKTCVPPPTPDWVASPPPTSPTWPGDWLHSSGIRRRQANSHPGSRNPDPNRPRRGFTDPRLEGGQAQAFVLCRSG
ncbi:enoyl-CoA hydratase-related protein [Streptomyces canus]|uniref:enoyl-CoA hydratase-related protein n=1 Tax=Streptomyces canus TaxID=58343 RepID=UPI0038647932|nr:enoyl-CoA hydratase-related protein [Streptomyces canus]